MNEFKTDFLIKQSLRSLAHTCTMGLLSSKEKLDCTIAENEEIGKAKSCTNLLRSPEAVRMLNENAFKNLFNAVENATSKELLDETPEHGEAQYSEIGILSTFLKEVRNAKPEPLKNWSALQHYIYFIYRHAIIPKPFNSIEIYPSVFIKKIRHLVEVLIEEDKAQLYIRLITLIREYVLMAQEHFCCIELSANTSTHLLCLLSYYSAFCTAAARLDPLLPEFERLLREKFQTNWLCLNKSIFYHYFYMTPVVQSKLEAFEKLKEDKLLLESYACFMEEMKLVCVRWGNFKLQVRTLSCKQALENCNILTTDWKIFEEYKKIMRTNYWLIRTTELVEMEDVQLDAHILSLVGDTNYIADFLTDAQGRCVCEDCLAATFYTSNNTSMKSSVYQSQPASVCRLMMCHICQEPIVLETLPNHIVNKHDPTVQKSPKWFSTSPQLKKGVNVKKIKLTKVSSKNIDITKSKDTPFFKIEGTFKISNDSGETKSSKEPTVKVIGDSQVRSNSAQPRIMVADGPGLNTPSDPCAAIGESDLATEFSFYDKSICPSLESMLKLTGEDYKKSAKAIINKPIKDEVCLLPGEAAIKMASEPPTFSEMVLKFASKYNKCEESQTAKSVADCITSQQDCSCRQTTINLLRGDDLLTCTKVDEIFQNSSDPVNNKGVGLKMPSEALCRRLDLNSPTSNAATPVITTNIPKQEKTAPDDLNKAASDKKTANGVNLKPPVSTCMGHACGHKCKQEDEIDEKKNACQDTCDHQKETRKCDCTYCEVFGSSLPSHTHKSNETRDRLRSRLNQRKEKSIEASATIKNIGKNGGTSKISHSNGIVKPSSNSTIKVSTSSKISISNNNIKITATDGRVTVYPRNPDPSSMHQKCVPSVTDPKPPPQNPPVIESKTSATSSKLGVLNGTKSSASSNVAMKISSPLPHSDSSSLSTSSLNSLHENGDSRDINELLNYIEGNKSVDKVALARKKAAKKARQKLKKEQERERIEAEERHKEELRRKEEKRKEEERLKAEALLKQQTEKLRRNKKKQIDVKLLQNDSDTKSKKNKKKGIKTLKEPEKQLIEETIPAMVTIKRVIENNNCPPTVTITLKGSTPDQDKLLYTLVNGHSNEHHSEADSSKASKKKNKNHREQNVKLSEPLNVGHTSISKGGKNKKNKDKDIKQTGQELKVTLALEKNMCNGKESHTITKGCKTENQIYLTSKSPKLPTCDSQKSITEKPKKPVNKDEINIPMLRLPPGITITKIQGPPTNRSCKTTNDNATPQNQNVPVSKSGVIVVETEKLIQQSVSVTTSKKNKKKNKKKHNLRVENTNTKVKSGASMVTLKNPIFHTLQDALVGKAGPETDISGLTCNQQASIIKNENGMVTIRSPRLQHSLEKGSLIPNLLTDLKPVIGPDVTTPYLPQCHANFSDNRISSFNAQEILSGLPGIEITKVDKNSVRNEDSKKSCQAADVSIIPTSNGVGVSDRFHFDKDDWPYESVFTPKDILEDDLDAEERELEAFKRFCQQSVPPKQKEKVAHLNVKDIVFKKKYDVSYS